MCYNFNVSIISFITVTVCGVLALRLHQPILGSLMLCYGLMQLSEVLIWRGIDTNNRTLNVVGTKIGKYTLPAHNIAVGVGVLVAYWSTRKQPKVWLPLVVGILFYVGVLTLSYAKEKNEPEITSACDYKPGNSTNDCTEVSARLMWPYPHGWYMISFLISLLILLSFVRPLVPTGLLIAIFFVLTTS